MPATGIAPIPALYAMSYSNPQGGLSVAITNKSATAHQVTVRINGAAATGTFPLQFITAADPSTANTSTSRNAISIQNASSANPITVPPYSVLRADIVTPATIQILHSASYQTGPVAPAGIGDGVRLGLRLADHRRSQPALLLATLGDTSISITDSKGITTAAPLYYVSANQASFLIPGGVAAGAASVKVARNGATVLTGSIT